MSDSTNSAKPSDESPEIGASNAIATDRSDAATTVDSSTEVDYSTEVDSSTEVDYSTETDESTAIVPTVPTDLSPSRQPSWRDRLFHTWQQATQEIGKRLPLEAITQPIAQTAMGWFNVSDQQLADILDRVRAELPTTEALLIGKPQSGKSSIVRGLTGVSADIVGQGFRPHTQHTQRYAYPAADLPLIIFTDTVGLGDVSQDTAGLIQELETDLDQATTCARVLILTVKITDFATDRLRQITQQLRQRYPQIPCLLAITCLHELYPTHDSDHPAYPPTFPELDRAAKTIQANFSDLTANGWRTVCLDFTLEEDGYSPIFYGLEAFRDALADLLPEAEARTIHQLLDGNTADQIGNLYRDVGRRYLLAFSLMAATLAAVPIPLATMPVLTALQVSMVGLLGNLYGQPLSRSQAGGIVSAIAGGFLAQAIGRELIKFIPGIGSVIAASWAAAYTWALGEAACVYFGDLMGGKKPNPDRIQAVMKDAFKSAQDRFKGI